LIEQGEFDIVVFGDKVILDEGMYASKNDENGPRKSSLFVIRDYYKENKRTKREKENTS